MSGEAAGRDLLASLAPAAAVVFDFDGTLVDTEPVHYRAFRDTLRPHGIRLTWEDYLARYVGLDDRDVFRLAFRDRRDLLEDELAALAARKGSAFSAESARRAPEPYPGARTWLSVLRGRIPLALCSGALAKDILPILRRNGLAGAFDVAVTAEDPARGKPHPEPYRLALRRLRARFPGRRFPPAACLAVEDTAAGIRSARGAGLRVLALAHTHSRRELAEADACLGSLKGLRPDPLLAGPGGRAGAVMSGRG